MIKLGKVTLGGTPRIVVGFNDRTSAAVLAGLKKSGLDIAELRIDQYASFKTWHVLEQIARFRYFSTIATIRSKKEGGCWTLSESARLQLFETVIPKVNAVDIELSAKEILPRIVKSAHKAKKLAVVSYHDFKQTPDARSLLKILKKAKMAGADIVKIAVMAVKKGDLQTLAAFTIAHASQNIVTIAMGPAGIASRILFPALGSLMTYACLSEPIAPGQLNYEATRQCLRIFYPAFNRRKSHNKKG